VIPSLLWLTGRLARRHDVVVYVLRYFDRPQRYQLAGATISDLGRPEGTARQYKALVTALREDGPFDLLHAYWALPAGLVATLAGRRLGAPCIVTLDSGELVWVPEIGYGLQGRWRQRLGVAAACRMATRITVCSRYYEQIALAAGVRPDVVPLGVDTAVFRPPPVRRDGPPWRLIHVASLNRVKDQPLLVATVAALVTRGLDVHLDVVGEDTLGGAVHTLVHEAGAGDRVTFHGYVPSPALAALYHQAHVAVLTSYHEAAAVVALEAAACGVPTVGTRVGYIADWAPDAAVAVPDRSPARLADEVERLLLDRGRRDRLAAAARQWTLAHDADWTAARFEELYHATARSADSHADKSRPMSV
jgi:glycosyltransferase involved in cell wall biosynthesis